jgi:hypothetical protein
LLQLFFPAAAEAFTELESEGKELPSLALKGRNAHGNNLTDAAI